MYFDSFAAFIHMGGHGYYVWLAYSVALAVVVALLLIPGVQKKRFVRAYRQSLRRRQQPAPTSHELETKA